MNVRKELEKIIVKNARLFNLKLVKKKEYYHLSTKLENELAGWTIQNMRYGKTYM